MDSKHILNKPQTNNSEFEFKEPTEEQTIHFTNEYDSDESKQSIIETETETSQTIYE